VTAPVTAPAPFVHVHRVRFDEIDAAGIAYFANFFRWCHDALEALLDPIDGGYAALVTRRRLGLPAVHVEADFSRPLRFGDEVHLGVSVERIGASSCTLRFELKHSDGGAVATVRHVVVLTDLSAMKSRSMPDDVRAVLERYLTP
jgi:4-hydroxybenzoyl-CoA thioesterase